MLLNIIAVVLYIITFLVNFFFIPQRDKMGLSLISCRQPLVDRVGDTWAI